MGNQMCSGGTSWVEAEGKCAPQSSVCGRGTVLVDNKCYIAPALMTDDMCSTQLVSPDNADGTSTYSGGTCNYKGKDSTYCAYPSCVGIQNCEASSAADGKGYASNFCEGSNRYAIQSEADCAKAQGRTGKGALYYGHCSATNVHYCGPGAPGKAPICSGVNLCPATSNTYAGAEYDACVD